MVESQGVVETHHACLIVWGHFASQSGLVEAVMGIPLSQKTYSHTPQSKLLAYLVATLAGLPRLKDISCAAHPLTRDLAVASAWELGNWADYTGISRTLRALTDHDVDVIIATLDRYSEQFLMPEINQTLLAQQRLILDGDLTGLPVSRTSRSYPDAAFGYMGDTVQLGYQAALVSMVSITYGRLWLAVQHHPGSTVSCTEAGALARAAEARLGLRPWRRPQLVQQRLGQVAAQLAKTQARQATQLRLVAAAEASLASAQAALAQRQAHLASLAGQDQALADADGPDGPLVQAQHQVAVATQRCSYWAARLSGAQARLAHTAGLVAQREAACGELRIHLTALEHDNATNPHPLQIVIRLDAGFGTYENIALLAELGYEVITKAKNQRVAQARLRCVDAQTAWTAVGANAELAVWPQASFKNSPYPLDAALQRFILDAPKHTVLLHYGDMPVATDPAAWFLLYNQRQTIEAGIKESKDVFQLHHLKVRTAPALRLQEYLVVFAANFIRWANHWLMAQRPDPDAKSLDLSKLGIKHWVQVAAHLSATVSWYTDGCLLTFSDQSCYAGLTLSLTGYFHQLGLPWFTDAGIRAISTIP